MGRHWDHQSYYEILEVEKDAHESEIRVAYHRARQTYSKDNVALLSVFTPEEAAALLELVEEAYTILSHPESRKAYDQKLIRERGDAPERHAADFFLLSDEPGTAEDKFPVFTVTPPEPAPEPQPTAQPDNSARRNSGLGRTPLSTYEIDPDIEATMAAETSFSGGFLKVVREYKNLDIDQISEHTRIGKEYLRAVEAEDYDRLPAPVFVRGFLVQLARIYGLNTDQLCKSYLERLRAHKE